ncbi:hypothetical protein AB0O01_14605 [Streptomyces sp. NPDC093252]|uniref:hypothetical protein n=1 Tax=Streptomyces sp. NPDC093252 TaxID=3154980 RepID=UPI0034294A7C
MDISGTPTRVVRAALFTALVVTLGTASHVLLSGVPLPLGTVAAAAAAVFAVAYLLAGRREQGLGRIAAVLIPLELAVDTLFTAGQQTCYGAAGGPVTGPLRAVGLDVLCGGPVGSPLARMTATTTAAASDPAAALFADADPRAAWLLLAVHVGIGLLAALWLHRGERALAQVLAAASAATFRPLLLAVAAVTVRPAPAAPRRPRPAHRAAAVRDLLRSHTLGRRGPPVGVTFA